ncbi:MAG TPA: N-acetyl-gamma-glutamyl-phosphate reductase [Longimicrobiales bacterium]|nr:N-acetyl-gamma-glutamyl-phosphate reductase [Longimicrobiales bacterium]
MNKKPIRAGIAGASGYTGLVLTDILTRHPRLELVFATSESEAGEPVPGTELRYIRLADADLAGVDVFFSCLPHGESGAWAVRAWEAGAVAVDLSADLRGGESGAVYGLPELWREEVAGARLIANPGCYPTGVLVALAPAVSAGVVDRSRPVVVNAASGVTGAGRSARRDLLFAEVAEDYRAYGVGNRHRHVAEMNRGLVRVGGGVGVQFVFTPHLLPVRRGILETILLPLEQPLSESDAVAVWAEAYEGEPFIEVLGTRLPSLRDVVGRNVVSLGFSTVDGLDAPALLVVAALDNLVKGAAGQAVQNANLALGLDEREGLRL